MQAKYLPEYFYPENVPVNITLAEIEQAIRNKDILEFKVSEYLTADKSLKMNFDHNLYGIIQIDDLEFRNDDRKTQDKSAMFKVGRHIKFIPMSIEDDGDKKKVICSRKLAQQDCINNYVKYLTPGDVIDVRMANIADYGIFTDIGCGVIALLPSEYISILHIKNQEKTFIGVTNFKAVVKSNIDNKVVLTHKELLGTWKEEASQFNKGQIVDGVVVSKQDYGNFIRISQNLSALADITEIDINTGDHVKVKITFINEQNMKIKLIVLGKDESHKEEIATKFKYYITEGHIDKWIYSTQDYKKMIFTDFSLEGEANGRP